MAPLEDAEYAFQGRDMMNGLGRRCVIPVSYTHLDVYKRQQGVLFVQR